jgi:glycosyltransferase involved in cell wall biosynthesis
VKLVYVSQPFDRLFPPVQNSIGLIVYYTALELSRHFEIAIYSKYYRDDTLPGDLPFAVRRFPVWRDRILQRVIRRFPQAAHWLRLDSMAVSDHHYSREVRRSLANDCPDLVHVMNSWNWCQGLKTTGSSPKIVLEMQCEWLSQRDHGEVARQLEVVDAVVTVSDHVRREFSAAFPSYPGIVATVGNGVDVSQFEPRADPTASVAKTGRRILFVGRVSPEKGLHTLIEAFSEVADKLGDVELQLAGPRASLSLDFVTSLSSDPRVIALSRFYDRAGRSTYHEHLDELVMRHGLGGRVRFIGNVSHKELVAAYQDADIVVNPSLSESFGISVVEAMACGVPVVGTSVGGMCESVLNGTTGVLVEPDAPGELARAILSVLENPARMREMGLEGRKRAVALYSWGARAERLAGIYKRLSAESRYGLPGQRRSQPAASKQV